MTKKNYIKMADIIKKYQVLGYLSLVEELSKVFKEDNPNFDEKKFVKRCTTNE